MICSIKIENKSGSSFVLPPNAAPIVVRILKFRHSSLCTRRTTIQHYLEPLACKYLYAPNASAPPRRIIAYSPMPIDAAWSFGGAAVVTGLLAAEGAGSPS